MTQQERDRILTVITVPQMIKVLEDCGYIVSPRFVGTTMTLGHTVGRPVCDEKSVETT